MAKEAKIHYGLWRPQKINGNYATHTDNRESRDSVVCLATDYDLDDPGSEFESR
jgi:hypothetical protein